MLALSELKLLPAFQGKTIHVVSGITINLVVKVEKPSSLHWVPCKPRDINRSADHNLISHLYEGEEEIYDGRMEGNWNTCNKCQFIVVACSIHLGHIVQAFSPFFIGTKDMEYKNVVYIHFILIYIKRQRMAKSTKFVFIFTIMLWSLYCVRNTHIYTYIYMWCICVNLRKILLVDILNILHVKNILRYPMSYNLKFVGF